MSLGTSEAPANSPTQTKTNEERARDPKDNAPIDAETQPVGEQRAKGPAAPRVAKLTDVKPLKAEEVFGGPVNEASNAKAPRGEANGTQAGAKKGGKGKRAQAPAQEPITAEEYLETAVGMFVTLDMVTRGFVASRYADILEPQSLADLDARIKLKPPQVEGMSKHLAKGLEESGTKMPWYVALGFAASAVYVPMVGTLGGLEKAKRAHDEAEEAAKKAKGGK